MPSAKISSRTTTSRVSCPSSSQLASVRFSVISAALWHHQDLNLLFQLLDRIPNVEPLLANLESYIVSEGLMVMKANSDTITTVSGSGQLLHATLLDQPITHFEGPREIRGTASGALQPVHQARRGRFQRRPSFHDFERQSMARMNEWPPGQQCLTCSHLFRLGVQNHSQRHVHLSTRLAQQP